VLAAMKLTRGAITDSALAQLRDRLLEAGNIDALHLPGLDEERRPVIAGGVLVLEAAFRELGLTRMQVSATAMREGILDDMLGRASQRDPRDASIEALARRYAVDRAQAARVESTALELFDQITDSWPVDREESRALLGWACRVHEIGLSIAHSQHQVHGAYLLRHSDIAGFSTQEQELLAALVRNQRRGFHRNSFATLTDAQAQQFLRSALLMRIAVLLHRSHDPAPLPSLQIGLGVDRLSLGLPASWLEQHPLTRSDFDAERQYLAEIGVQLDLQPR
jgi:exopolyphosphatase/guanosine-5'-triphosphate,3'-diphosphate pyrophosphatase